MVSQVRRASVCAGILLAAVGFANLAYGWVAVDEKYITDPPGGGGYDFSLRTYDELNREIVVVSNGNQVVCTIPSRISYGNPKADVYWDAPVRYFGFGAFKNRTTLQSVVIPSSIRPLLQSDGNPYDQEVFRGCTGLRSATLYCDYVGKGWFRDCTLLREIDLSNITREIMPFAFYGSGLEKLKLLNSSHSSTIRESYRFAECAWLKEVELKSGVAGIGGYDFRNCTALRNVTIPESVAYLGTGAFKGCTSLTNATILGCSSTTDHDGIFYGCTGLRTVAIGDGVTKLNWAMFQNCTSLERVTIGSGVTELPAYLFANCTSLKSIVFKGNAPVCKAFAFQKVPSSCTVYVHRDSTGWGVSIPGTWQGLKIVYIGGSTPVTTTCVVKFNANGGSMRGVSRIVRVNSSIGALPGAPTRKGYKFKGWYTKKSGGSKISSTTKVKKNTTYYAQWTANKYTIKFNRNGGKGTMKALSATYDKNVTLRANAFKRTGYKFKGWAKTKKGKVAYKNKAKVKNLTATKGKTVTLYAVWKKAKASSAKPAATAAKPAAAVAAVPAWAVGTFYDGDENAFTTITVSKAGKVSGKVLFADGSRWTIVGSAVGQRLETVVTDAGGNSAEVVFAVVKTPDGRCRIESEDGTTWAGS